MRTFDLFFVFRGQECQLVGEIEPPDHDVGIMGIGISGFQVYNAYGQELTLTAEEDEAIATDPKLLDRVSELHYCGHESC